MTHLVHPAATNSTRVGVGLGSSEAATAEQAGEQAATAAMAQLGQVRPGLVVVYASVRYDLHRLLAAIRAVTGETTPLVGASSSGHFHAGTLTQPGEGVAVLVLGDQPYTFGVATATGLHDNPFATGEALANAASGAMGQPAANAALLALPCGVDMNLERFIDGIYRVTGAAVPVFGGAASDDRKMQQTYVFRDGEVLADAAVGVWIGSPHPLRMVFGHGWQARGLPMEITGFDGPLIRSIDGRPAMEVFQQQLHCAKSSNDLALRGPDTTPEDAIVRLAEAGRCIGIIEPDGSRMLRGVFAEPGGRVRTWLPLPPYAAVQIMTCTQDQLLDVCDQIGKDAASSPHASVVLAFSCVARHRMLRDRSPEEAQRLQRAAGDIPVFGFYSYGELAGTTSNNGVHNAALTALAL